MTVKTQAVLLVEDNPEDVDLTLRAFRKNDFANPIAVTRNGVEAFDYLNGTGAFPGRDAADLPALVLLDLKMPRMGGLDLLRRIRSDERLRMLPVVVFSSSNEKRDLAQSYASGANSYVRKPIDFNRFTEAVRLIGLYWLALNEPPPGTEPPHEGVAERPDRR